MSTFIDALLSLAALCVIAGVIGFPFRDNPTLIAFTDGDLYEEGDA